MTKNSDDQVWSFLQDDRFIKWVNEPDRETIAYWEDWLEQHREQQEALFKARQIVRDLARAETPADADQLSVSIWNSVKKDIDRQAPVIPMHIGTDIGTRSLRIRYGMVAAVTGLLLLGAGLFYYRKPASVKLAAQHITNILVNEDLKRTNQTAGNQSLYLVDGSKVILKPGSSIRHAVFLQKDKREIYLEGDAFFEVAKDPARPFYVYTKDIVMRVLGTSFNVTTDTHNGDVTVVVRTGKVSVYKKAARLASQLILTSNQKVLYKALTNDLICSRLNSIETRSNLIPVSPAFDFNFEEAPVGKIFNTLENAYGIPVHFDGKSLSKCVVTTSLGEEEFEEKLKVICAAIGATYKIDGNGVLIEGGSCSNGDGR
ncbi:MAG: FecR domain-containing protein [Puia sp.]|nr:FecR domain-containing protein [Puia sp.]